jgi:hypothetical protein
VRNLLDRSPIHSHDDVWSCRSHETLKPRKATQLHATFPASFRHSGCGCGHWKRGAGRLPLSRHAAGAGELERRVLDLRNELRNEGRFDVQFTHDQINGWLAADLPEKFPQLMPRGVSDPRLAFEPDLTRVACKYQDSRISAVVSLDADVYLTEDPTVVAVRLKQVRAGSLPIPLGQFLDQISRHATAAGLPLQWSETEGDPLALVTIPPLVDERANALLHLEAIEVLDGKVRFAGRTEPLSTERPGNGINYRQAAGGQKVKRTTQL